MTKPSHTPDGEGAARPTLSDMRNFLEQMDEYGYGLDEWRLSREAMERVLKLAIKAEESDGKDAERLNYAESKAATIYCSQSGHWVFVDERVKTRSGIIGVGIRGCIDAAMKEAK